MNTVDMLQEKIVLETYRNSSNPKFALLGDRLILYRKDCSSILRKIQQFILQVFYHLQSWITRKKLDFNQENIQKRIDLIDKSLSDLAKDKALEELGKNTEDLLRCCIEQVEKQGKKKTQIESETEALRQEVAELKIRIFTLRTVRDACKATVEALIAFLTAQLEKYPILPEQERKLFTEKEILQADLAEAKKVQSHLQLLSNTKN